VQSATLNMYADHATGDPDMQVQIYDIDKALDPTGAAGQYPTPNNIGIDATALSVYNSMLAPLEPNFWGAYKTFDVTDLVQGWADDRSTALILMLRDTQEDVAWQSRSSATVYFAPNGNTLSVNYTNPGWYMFQGNGRHTGRTQWDMPEDVVAKWSTPASLPTPSGYETESSRFRRIPPAVLAVPGDRWGAGDSLCRSERRYRQQPVSIGRPRHVVRGESRVRSARWPGRPGPTAQRLCRHRPHGRGREGHRLRI